jgi:hypothetical protein
MAGPSIHLPFDLSFLPKTILEVTSWGKRSLILWQKSSQMSLLDLNEENVDYTALSI